MTTILAIDVQMELSQLRAEREFGAERDQLLRELNVAERDAGLLGDMGDWGGWEDALYRRDVIRKELAHLPLF